MSQAVHTKEPMYYHKQTLDDWAQDASEYIRQVARYYRSCKESEDQKRATFKKALQTNPPIEEWVSNLERGGVWEGGVALIMSLGLP